MKIKFVLLLCVFHFFGIIKSQNNHLLGTYWTGSKELYSSFNISSKTLSKIDTLKGLQALLQGESTFDSINGRHIIKTNLGVTIIDIQNGNYYDTIANPLNIKGIEYDTKTGKIYGTYWNGSVEVFVSLDIQTKTYTAINNLPGIFFLTQGESTFDADNGRYFNKTNLGITVINIQNGNIIEALSSPATFKGIEFDPLTNKIFGTYWTGNEEIFASIDMISKSLTNIDTLKNVIYLMQGESTFDHINGRYFNKTNMGITIINKQTGAILDTALLSVNFKCIEYSQSNPMSLEKNINSKESTYKIYPNPTSDIVHLNSSNNDLIKIKITDVNGRTMELFKLSNTEFDLRSYKSGLYFIHITDKNDSYIRKIVKL